MIDHDSLVSASMVMWHEVTLTSIVKKQGIYRFLSPNVDKIGRPIHDRLI
jgi:hypothetical protein